MPSSNSFKAILSLDLFLFLLTSVSLYALTSCPLCGYKINRNIEKCPKCLKLFNTDLSQEKPIRSKITVRTGTDVFIRHPHANNRAYKADKNAGGDKTGEIGCWGGSGTLRYLIRFNMVEAMKKLGINFTEFKPKKALLLISAVNKRPNIQVPIIVYPLKTDFYGGSGKFRARERRADGSTWYKATSEMPWRNEGGDYETAVFAKGTIKTGERNQIDITRIIKYFYNKSRIEGEWNAPGIIVMSNPADSKLSSGFATIYSLDADEYWLRPELFIE